MAGLVEIGTRMREARKRLKLTQAQVANETGVSRSTVSLLENGSMTEIGIRKVIRILDYLGLELIVRPEGAPPTLEELQQERKKEQV